MISALLAVLLALGVLWAVDRELHFLSGSLLEMRKRREAVRLLQEARLMLPSQLALGAETASWNRDEITVTARCEPIAGSWHRCTFGISSDHTGVAAMARWLAELPPLFIRLDEHAAEL